MARFGDLKDGQQFAVGETVFWKVLEESEFYNAVECKDSSKAIMILDDCEVELEHE
ncbi:hypothetical protein Fifi44_00001 [Erwinia phage Fifi44]|uniref:Uncharacterized protein n=1 Tax=Erwinia phage Fifi44 TaxID=2876597 RepID=A0AAE8Y1A8_9CAUD|nr:hypothetical protein QNG95_gp01 [Erwinia phage Fifi44]UCR74870.1 hypothetical protein Fifi44_00001 [Erwinia phage Fifi44]UCR80896.1 hypothetical protein Fifi451_00076 [Erwinia phage Fifi451]